MKKTGMKGRLATPVLDQLWMLFDVAQVVLISKCFKVMASNGAARCIFGRKVEISGGAEVGNTSMQGLSFSVFFTS